MRYLFTWYRCGECGLEVLDHECLCGHSPTEMERVSDPFDVRVGFKGPSKEDTHFLPSRSDSSANWRITDLDVLEYVTSSYFCTDGGFGCHKHLDRYLGELYSTIGTEMLPIMLEVTRDTLKKKGVPFKPVHDKKGGNAHGLFVRLVHTKDKEKTASSPTELGVTVREIALGLYDRLVTIEK